MTGDAPSRPHTASTYLFVPAHEERKVERALAAGSDAVILDLEDGVPEGRKVEGREAVARHSRLTALGARPEVWVRVNDYAGRHFLRDAEAVNWRGVAGAILPKAEEPAGVRVLEEAGASRIILVVESAAGLAALPALAAASPAIQGAAIGTWDLALDLELIGVDDPDDSELIWQLRGQLVVDSRRLRWRSPIDGIYARFNDDDGFRQVAQRAFRMGYRGKFLIHPRQIPVANGIFVPNQDSVHFAREVVAAYERVLKEGRGVAQVMNVAIDRPMVERARAVLERSRQEPAPTDANR